MSAVKWQSDEWNGIRDVAVAFMRLTPTTRLGIAEDLGLDDGLDALDGKSASIEVCRRVHDAGCFDEFAAQVRTRTPITPIPST